MSLSTNFPTVGPVLNLDFVNNQTLDPRITFTRASTATYYDYAGVLRTAQNNIPRFDYNPSTLVPQGLLIEESRTNLFVRSEDFSTTWATVNAAIVTNSTVAPDGTTTADTFNVTDATNALKRTQQILSPVPTGANAFSVYVKAGTQNFVQLLCTGDVQAFANFDVSAGTVGTAGTKTTASIQNVGSGWYRCVVVFDATTVYTGATFRIQMVTSASAIWGSATPNTGTFFLWGAQLEAGAFATSYIQTVAATVTRQADAVSMTGTNFSSWYNPAEGTLYSEAEISAVVPGTTNFTVSSISDGVAAAGNFTVQRFNSGAAPPLQFAGLVGNVVQWSLVSANLTVGTFPRAASAYKFNDIAQSVNAGTVGTDTSATIPVVNRLDLGAGVGILQLLNGHLRKFSYYNFRMTNAQLQALTRS